LIYDSKPASEELKYSDQTYLQLNLIFHLHLL